MAKSYTHLLVKVVARFGELNFKEQFIDGNTHAMWEPDGTITINPIIDTVDSVVHEVLHELFPDYSERAIRSLTGKLIKEMDDATMVSIFEEYKRKIDGE